MESLTQIRSESEQSKKAENFYIKKFYGLIQQPNMPAIPAYCLHVRCRFGDEYVDLKYCIDYKRDDCLAEVFVLITVRNCYKAKIDKKEQRDQSAYFCGNGFVCVCYKCQGNAPTNRTNDRLIGGRCVFAFGLLLIIVRFFHVKIPPCFFCFSKRYSQGAYLLTRRKCFPAYNLEVRNT